MNNIQATIITVTDIKLINFPLSTSDLLMSREDGVRDELRLSVDKYLLWLSGARRGASTSKACNSPEGM